jgi:hypothetical protein
MTPKEYELIQARLRGKLNQYTNVKEIKKYEH